MSSIIHIGEREVEIAWTQDLARRVPFRSSKIGGAPTTRAMSNPKTSIYAVTAMLWLLLPADEHDRHATPEDLFLAIDHESDGADIHAALVAIFSEMAVTDEKKSSGKKSPSRKSS